MIGFFIISLTYVNEWPTGVGKDDVLASEERKRACHEGSAVTERRVEVVLRETSKHNVTCREGSAVTENSVEVVLRKTSKHIRTIEPRWAGWRRGRLTTRGATDGWVSPL